ncbi:DUF2490 domain-containing protein [uncultured Sphingomonas sp.]|uniref:DUF2490 domain-containing protein n=1 Tax=uncultured Sphingomonas sp. TaxID=158754 RepID=UPI0025D0421B|nr:DUF2490 domain-containing protein [uncultured Sphingomonas sp.]
MIARRLLPCLALFAAGSLPAETVHDEQTWVNATVMGTLPDSRIAYFVEVQPRYSLGHGRLEQLLLRPAIGVELAKGLTVYGGYAHVVLPIENGRDRNEERLFGQVSWTIGGIGAGSLSSRTRLEHRNLSDGDDTGWRLREMLRYVHPLGDPDRARFLVYGEGFLALNDTDWGARGGFDQLRSFVGTEVPIGGKSTLELGYLNQASNNTGNRLRMNHIASITIFVRR